jgi:hypothetical protein
MTKEEFLHRPDDIKLPDTWEQMRQNQRELAWPKVQMALLMANCNPDNHSYSYTGESLLESLGLGGIL